MDEGDPPARPRQDFRPLGRLPPPAVRQPLAMAGARRGAAGGRRGRPLRLLPPLLLLLLGAAVPPPPGAQGRRLICWQAMLQCQEEPQCGYAYSQYAEACAPVLMAAGDGPAAAAAAPPAAPPASSSSSSSRRRCPSHCIAALIQLNHTRRGPALEDCDCARDEGCRATKRAIEPCLPRAGGVGGGAGGGGGGGGALGCTEARRRCDRDSRCSAALGRYMAHCGKLFNGLRCTEQCRAVIEDMLAVPKALLLNDCVCDGLERPICESVKENMARLCFGADAANGAGSSGASDGAHEDYDDEDYDDELPPRGRDDLEEAAAAAEAGKAGGNGAAAPPRLAPGALLAAASLVLLLLW